ncbi:response regulator [Bacillus sp. SD088]|uniref:response regulator n=1 Tax=Bacillus sp. SD088 TaxID=2782012 RepID=UPI001A95F223|nr:response regulator transcription factor [Bacillus sp. SD088]MBO0995995.1 response regulator transcription factor [Bacillus sp. SD088]
MRQTTSIMLVDDHSLLRSGLKLLLQKKPFIKIVGEASDGHEALRMYEDLKPDLLILDISMPKLDGIQVLKKIKKRHENSKVIVLTMHEDKEYVTLAIQAGADGYIPKAAVDEELYTAIDSILKGHPYLRPTELSSVFDQIKAKDDPKNPYTLLSPRERQVLKFISNGYTLTEISNELMISIKTVDTHKTRLMNKLDVNRKSELVKYATKYNLKDI